MIDEHSGNGLIQLETKAYKASRIDSFAFEIHVGTELPVSTRYRYSIWRHN